MPKLSTAPVRPAGEWRGGIDSVVSLNLVGLESLRPGQSEVTRWKHLEEGVGSGDGNRSRKSPVATIPRRVDDHGSYGVLSLKNRTSST